MTEPVAPIGAQFSRLAALACDDDLGRVPYALVQADGTGLDEGWVLKFLRERIAAYKVPRTVEFVDSPLRDDVIA